MKIAIIAIGTRGDIQPCVALAKELKKRNTEVFIATFAEYKNLITSNNIEYKEIPDNPAKQQKKNKFEKYLASWLSKSLELSSDSDALIYTPPFIVGAHLAEKLKIPYFPVIFEPSIQTEEFPSPHQPIKYNASKNFNRLSYSIPDGMFWFRMKKKINKLRNEILQLPSLFSNPYKEMREKKVPFLTCYSKNLIPKPKDWYDEIQVEGYWFLNSMDSNISEELENYLNNGKPPIFIDFGSFAGKRITNKLKFIINNLNNSGERILIDANRLLTEKIDLPQNSFLMKENIPHEWLLPKIKAIIMHGGVGVTHAALRAGIPSIPVPFIGTQYFWAEKLYALGLSSKPIYFKKLKEGNLLDAINQIDDTIIAKAKTFNKEMKKEEDAASHISDFIINYVKKKYL